MTNVHQLPIEAQSENNHPSKTALMIDLEFLSLTSQAYPLSLGACVFKYDATDTISTFYRSIRVSDSDANYFDIDIETVMWWMRQGEQARTSLEAPVPISLYHALQDFNNWLVELEFYTVWSRGHLDIEIMKYCYGMVELEMPFTPYLWRDCRTLDDFTAKSFVTSIENRFLAHHALDDAKKQALVVQHVYQRWHSVLLEMGST